MNHTGEELADETWKRQVLCFRTFLRIFVHLMKSLRLRGQKNHSVFNPHKAGKKKDSLVK